MAFVSLQQKKRKKDDLWALSVTSPGKCSSTWDHHFFYTRCYRDFYIINIDVRVTVIRRMIVPFVLQYELK